MLWIAGRLPELPLEVAAADAVPLAVCDASHVLLASRSAREIGVQARMRRATALAICPHLHIKLRTYAQENHALQAIAAWAQRFTPSVALVPPCEESDADLASGLLLEISGSVKLFNGHARIVNNLRAGLARQGHVVQMALAPVPQAAWMLQYHCKTSLQQVEEAAVVVRPDDLGVTDDLGRELGQFGDKLIVASDDYPIGAVDSFLVVVFVTDMDSAQAETLGDAKDEWRQVKVAIGDMDQDRSLFADRSGALAEM